MPQERILITVKTYPTLSQKYGETVCTAGIREDGSWIRLYPVPFRRLDEQEQYRKYDWIELDVRKSTKDPRPETFHPTDASRIRVVSHLDTDDSWKARRKALASTLIYNRLTPLLEGAKNNSLSLAIFKPAKILDFIWEPGDRDWDAAKLEAMRYNAAQEELFSDDEWRRTFRLIPKLPYKLSYRFEDVDGRQSELQILDWEAGQLYFNCLRAANGNESVALAKVRQKYFESFLQTDLHFYLGTMKEFHGFSPNPWIITGALPLPFQTGPEQLEFF